MRRIRRWIGIILAWPFVIVGLFFLLLGAVLELLVGGVEE